MMGCMEMIGEPSLRRDDELPVMVIETVTMLSWKKVGAIGRLVVISRA